MLENSAKTKAVFSEETSLIEFGLKLMWDSTNITQKAQKDFVENPNRVANTNLFGRNRQFLTNAYSCMLFATYVTQFVDLRVVLKNNNLMRLFNFSHRQAYAWLDKDKQNEFSPKIQNRYKKCKTRKHFGPSSVLKKIHKKTGHNKAKINTAKIYGQLCDYTQPNFLGWQELMGIQGQMNFFWTCLYS